MGLHPWGGKATLPGARGGFDLIPELLPWEVKFVHTDEEAGGRDAVSWGAGRLQLGWLK